MNFSDFGLRQSILDVMTSKGYMSPTLIQEQTWTAFAEGKNILGQSQTGSGKTTAFLLPILHHIDPVLKYPQALIITPTRELAMQIQEDAFELTRGFFGVRCSLVSGGLSMRKQIFEIQKGPQVVVGTPGRILDMLEKRIIDPNKIKYFVIDEVDRMLDMGFIDDVEYIWSKFKHLDRSMCFSATMPSEVKDIIDRNMSDYIHIRIHTEPVVSQLDHSFIHIQDNPREYILKEYIDRHKPNKTVIFTQTKIDTADLYRQLRSDGYNVVQLHGDIDQYDRIKTVKLFKANDNIILIATDVASRGMNFNDIDLVINYDVPQDPESYIHRVGRTARAGQSGRAIMLINDYDKARLHSVEKRNKITIRQTDINGEELERVIPLWNQKSHGGSRGGSGGSRFSKYGGSRGGFASRTGYRGGDRRGDTSIDRFGSSRRDDRGYASRSSHTRGSYQSEGHEGYSRFSNSSRGGYGGGGESTRSFGGGYKRDNRKFDRDNIQSKNYSNRKIGR